MRLEKLLLSCCVLWVASAIASVTVVQAATVVISTAEEANDRGFREPVGATSNNNVSGSDAVGDSAGGTSALIMEVTTAKPRSTVAYTTGSGISTIQDVIDLGEIQFDIYVDTALGANSTGAAFKVKCGGTAKNHELNPYPTPGAWTRYSIDPADASFNGKTLQQWKDDTGWCAGRFDSVQAFEVGIGDSTTYYELIHTAQQ